MAELKFPSFPNADAIRAIERRGLKLLPSGDWHTVWQEQHQTAFTVAQSAGFDILSDIYNALHKAIDSGITYEQFRQELEPVLVKKGWWGRDRETGKMLGAPWRLKTIFQTNLRVSAAQGEWRTAQELKGLRPYLWYNAILDKRTRPLHASWDNIVLPVDDPWWNTHFPPNGWNCRCKALSVDEDDIRMHGLKIADKAPDDGFTEWENPATGEKITVPNGIDPGWAYNPGAVNQLEKAEAIAAQKKAAMLVAAGNVPAPVVSPVGSLEELGEQIRKHVSQFTRNGPIKEVNFRDMDAFMSTNQRGRYSISTRRFAQCGDYHPSEDLKNAWNTLASGKDERTFNEEQALKSLWHETIHNRQVVSNAGKPESGTRVMLETVTEYVARRTYPDFIRALGGRAIHAAAMKTGALGYARPVRNFAVLLQKLGVDDERKIIEFLEEVIKKNKFSGYTTVIANYLYKNKRVEKGSRENIVSLLKDLDTNPQDFDWTLKWCGLL